MAKNKKSWEVEPWVKGDNFYEFIKDFTINACNTAEVDYNERVCEELFCDEKEDKMTFYRYLTGLCHHMEFFYKTLDIMLLKDPQYRITVQKTKQEKDEN